MRQKKLVIDVESHAVAVSLLESYIKAINNIINKNNSRSET